MHFVRRSLRIVYRARSTLRFPPTVPQPTEWQRSDPNAAMDFARADFVNVCIALSC